VRIIARELKKASVKSGDSTNGTRPPGHIFDTPHALVCKIKKLFKEEKGVW